MSKEFGSAFFKLTKDKPSKPLDEALEELGCAETVEGIECWSEGARPTNPYTVTKVFDDFIAIIVLLIAVLVLRKTLIRRK